MPPSRALIRLRRAFESASRSQTNIHSHFHLPPPPTQPVPHAILHSPITSYTLPDAISLVRLNTDSLFAETLLRWRASTESSMTALGDSLLLFRTHLRQSYLDQLTRTLQRAQRGKRPSKRIVTRLASSSSLCNAAAGMGLAALVAQEERELSAPTSLLRLLSSTKGPQRAGIGWLSPEARAIVGGLLLSVMVNALGFVVMLFPHAVPWVLVSVAVCFAARPELESFRAWTRRCAPMVARRKTMLLDKVRASVAPYVMGLNPPVLDDYGVCSVVTVVDGADYVYVYVGFLGRWMLLGWYNRGDDYNFDKIRGR
eukprot:GFKZ01015878.1.p1 GENE.GFKZ01015878.1~~GFKZ01015878.1.p1  ORF type:complete len:321 (+),score=29.48 GFKZ01015878.1:26-964(+)